MTALTQSLTPFSFLRGKTKALLAAALIAPLLLVASPSYANRTGDVVAGVLFGGLVGAAIAHSQSAQAYSSGYQPVYQQPVYVRPAPVYVHPQPVYVQPQPVYVQPAPQVYYQPRPYHHHHHGYGGYGGQGWYGHGRW